MFKSVLLLGHFRGIRLEVHVSWLFIFALLVVTMSTGLQQQFSHWSLGVAITTAVVTALAFFASILAHELGHSLVAMKRGIPVKAITLFIFGGMAQMSSEAKTAGDEFKIAIAGPIVSLVLALTFAVLSGLTIWLPEPVSVALGWLAVINLVVAIFNMVPGFPLDGGRVFRALVWKLTGDASKGNRAAVAGGRLVSYGLFGLGLWNILVIGNLIGGLWAILIGWFLLSMAEGHGRSYDLRERLTGTRARDLADSALPMVAPETPIEEWVNQQVLPKGERAALVGERGQVHGLVSLSDARRMARDQWPSTPVRDVMTPLDQLITVEADTPATDVLMLMNEKNLNQIPVMDDKRPSGWIDRQRILRSIELHMELNRR